MRQFIPLSILEIPVIKNRKHNKKLYTEHMTVKKKQIINNTTELTRCHVKPMHSATSESSL